MKSVASLFQFIVKNCTFKKTHVFPSPLLNGNVKRTWLCYLLMLVSLTHIFEKGGNTRAKNQLGIIFSGSIDIVGEV